MKHLAFMIVLTVWGTVGNLWNSFNGVLIYYLFAVLRPQFLWEWALPTGVPWSRYVALATVAGLILGFPQKGTPGVRVTQWSPASKILILFGAWCCLTGLTAEHREVSQPWLEEYLKITLMFGVAACLLRTIDQARALLLTAISALCYIAYEMNFFYLVNGYAFIYRRGYGGLDNNGAALMLAMAAPCCLIIWNREQRWWRWVLLGSLPLIIHAILMSFSRGAMLALIAVTPLLLLRQRLLSWSTVFLTILLLAGLPLMAGKEIQERFFSIQQFQQDDSAQSRFTSWSIGWKMAQERPWLGFGLRNSNLYSFEYGADMAGRTIHSQYLQIAADSGLTGAGLYILALAMTWRSLARCRRLLVNAKIHHKEVAWAIMIADCVEASMAVFCFGALFLSLEVFELPYLMLLLGSQLEVVAAAVVPSVLSDKSHSSHM